MSVTLVKTKEWVNRAGYARLTQCRPVGAPLAPLECGCGGSKVLLVSTGAAWEQVCSKSAPGGLRVVVGFSGGLGGFSSAPGYCVWR